MEIFIDTIITNNEERTVEQAARRVVPTLSLKQWKYLSLPGETHESILKHIGNFNPNKERAFVRIGGKMHRWNSDAKRTESISDDILNGISLLRRDIPDTGAMGEGSESGVCYSCTNVSEEDLKKSALLEVFANPHASVLERIIS